MFLEIFLAKAAHSAASSTRSIVGRRLCDKPRKYIAHLEGDPFAETPEWNGLESHSFSIETDFAKFPINRFWLQVRMYQKMITSTATPVRIPKECVAAGLTFFFVPVCFYMDSGSDLVFQNALGVGAWLCLMVLLFSETEPVRLQVAVAIGFATIGEHFASIYMQGYIYRLQNVPAFVPPGHGLVYLTAIVLARSRTFERYFSIISFSVLLIASLWSLWGVLLAERRDTVGFVLFLIYGFCLWKGPSPKVYLGAFFITSWLELVGTYLGTWSWVPLDPASGLFQGNPPSGVAAWYCLVDAVAIACAPILADATKSLREKVGARMVFQRIYSSAMLAPIRWYVGHSELPVLALILFL